MNLQFLNFPFVDNRNLDNQENEDCSLLQSHLINENNNSLISLEEGSTTKKSNDMMCMPFPKNLDQSRLRRTEHMFNDSTEGLKKFKENTGDVVKSREDFQPTETAYSFSSNNQMGSSYQHLKKHDNSPLRHQQTPNQNQDTEDRVSNSDYGSRSRSRSGYRKIAHSPIEVNTSFELSQKNTQNLWHEFRENLKEGSATREPLRNVPNTHMLSNTQQRVENPQNFGYTQNSQNTETLQEPSEGFMDMKSQTLQNPQPRHFSKPSFTSNVDTNKFINTTKSEDKNTLLPERHLRKLIKLSGDEPQHNRDQISFDKNTQIMPFQPEATGTGTNKMSRASQFTFNSTEKQNSQGGSRNKEAAQ